MYRCLRLLSYWGCRHGSSDVIWPLRGGWRRGLLDRRLSTGLFRKRYRGLSVKHFHEHLVRDHNFCWGDTFTKAQWDGQEPQVDLIVTMDGATISPPDEEEARPQDCMVCRRRLPPKACRPGLHRLRQPLFLHVQGWEKSIRSGSPWIVDDSDLPKKGGVRWAWPIAECLASRTTVSSR